MRWIIALIFAATFSSACSAEESPREFVRRFYAAYKTWNIRGVPYPKHERLISPFLGMEVIKTFRSVNEQRDVWERKFPFNANAAKPPWCAEGDVFCNVWEGITNYSIGKVTLSRSRLAVEAHLELVYGGSVSKWTDRIILDRAGDSWVVADIEYGNGDSLLTSTRQKLKANAKYLKSRE